MAAQNLFDLLTIAGRESNAQGIIAYPLNNTAQARSLLYPHLIQESRKRAGQLQHIDGFRAKSVVVLHLDDHLGAITWFWAVLVAGCIPALSTPLPNDAEQRKQHLEHLVRLFDDPIVLTRASSRSAFGACERLRLHHVESLESTTTGDIRLPSVQPEDLAALMLTSGSTGNCKAVKLTHGQLMASLAGKASVSHLSRGHALMNWIGMDHVAALVETHLLGMYLGLDQVHVQPVDMVSSPMLFVEMISRHHVGRSVAPNFLLASLLKAIKSSSSDDLADIDISSLQQLVSGGEANPVKLVAELDAVLQSLGVPAGVIQPAFGMTETCAGSIYNTESPVFDLQSGMEFASLGRCVPGIEMRVVPHRVDEAVSFGSIDAARGTLEVRGPIITTGYYNNPTATAEAFSEDGWFNTGDEAIIDSTGHLHIVGRIKDHVRINGLAVIPTDIESHLNGLSLPGSTDDYYACFGFRHEGDATERLAVFYLPTYDDNDSQQRRETNERIVKAVMQQSGICPFVLPLGLEVMQKSTLGKLSRSKLRNAFLQGKLKKYEDANIVTESLGDAEDVSRPANELERQLLEVFRATLVPMLGIDENALCLTTPWFSIGVSSVHLIQLKRRIERALVLPDIPLVLLLTNSTIADLATAITTWKNKTFPTSADPDQPSKSADELYSPVVRMREGGSKTPLWLFHPGVGEILVFLNLARKLSPNRPIYAFRARGFEKGETFFSSIEEAVDTYHNAIKVTQPHGPYALAGYSYGAMLAFETAKRLEAGGEEVRFLASLNLPPHIKFRMQQLPWQACACHLAHFLGLLHGPGIPNENSIPREELVERVFDAAPAARLHELQLSPSAFSQWADLAHAMQSMARNYDPSGSVRSIDVFHCTPLAEVAKDRQDWIENHVGRWREFAGDVQLREVKGEHYTMIDAEHVDEFAEIFEEALTARGV